jgi:hypothetical protein
MEYKEKNKTEKERKGASNEERKKMQKREQ